MTDPSTSITPLPKGHKPWEGSSAVVEQGRHWSSTLVWLSSAIFGSVLIWGFSAKVDQTISVRGKLEPAGSVREVDSPASGVVSKVLVRDGETVTAGQPLLEVEAEGIRSQRQSTLTTIALLEAQNRSLQRLLDSNGSSESLGTTLEAPTNLAPALQEKVTTALQQTQQIKARLKQIDVRLKSRRETLALSQRIADDLKPLFENGGYSRIQYLQQLNVIQEQTSEISSLNEERESVIGSVAGLINQNNRDLANLKATLNQVNETLSYRTVKAPISGTIFNVQVSPSGFVATDQVVMDIVPSERLQAQVAISNSDVGFIKPGLPATVAVDSFPAGEFGYIQGTLTSLGSDALPPDSTNGMSRFPATISLKEQTVESGGRKLNLQSGMAVTANIKLRSRPVITLVSDMFTKQLDGVKQFR
ncbi:hlyD secretion family protein [Synechococcus sp. PROS-7-1]|uniref:HlyD family secretion protein n=1 Tax=Synechococcus sp. PROS-7-1 TaxID=1442556 RepID=UPI001861D900|nr:HlyD family secretion protein [Synechococcus sp. PROS-7-1]QNI83969.1 hlyD secretion family protein [Synechococcus sp. PROS-7-1]